METDFLISPLTPQSGEGLKEEVQKVDLKSRKEWKMNKRAQTCPIYPTTSKKLLGLVFKNHQIQKVANCIRKIKKLGDAGD